MFGNFDLAPCSEPDGVGEVRHSTIVPASAAKRLVGLCTAEPVAAVKARVAAKKAPATGFNERHPAIAIGLDRHERHGIGIECNAVPAPAAAAVLEIKNVLASLAGEKFHVGCPAAVESQNAANDLPCMAKTCPKEREAGPPSGEFVSISRSQDLPSGTAGSTKFETSKCAL